MFNLNPYTGLTSNNNGTHTLLSFRQLDPQKGKTVRRNMYKQKKKQQKPTADMASSSDGKAAAEPQWKGTSEESPGEDDSLQVPVFLNRNRRKMKELRKHLVQPSSPPSSKVDEKKPAAGELIIDNRLVMKQVPLIRKL